MSRQNVQDTNRFRTAEQRAMLKLMPDASEADRHAAAGLRFLEDIVLLVEHTLANESNGVVDADRYDDKQTGFVFKRKRRSNGDMRYKVRYVHDKDDFRSEPCAIILKSGASGAAGELSIEHFVASSDAVWQHAIRPLIAAAKQEIVSAEVSRMLEEHGELAKSSVRALQQGEATQRARYEKALKERRPMLERVAGPLPAAA